MDKGRATNKVGKLKMDAECSEIQGHTEKRGKEHSENGDATNSPCMLWSHIGEQEFGSVN